MVYVDNFYDTGVRYRGMKMCHMIADSTEELLEMVDKIGVQRKWIQHPGTCNEHFDICFSKRQKAVKLGAHEIHFKIYAAMIQNRASEGRCYSTLSSVGECARDCIARAINRTEQQKEN
jgi:hypothetical protein